MVANSINSVLQGATTTSVQEIDKLITELQTLRDTLHSERARVQREIVQYSTLTRATLESTKIVAESLMQFKKATDAPALPDMTERSVASCEAAVVPENSRRRGPLDQGESSHHPLRCLPSSN